MNKYFQDFQSPPPPHAPQQHLSTDATIGITSCKHKHIKYQTVVTDSRLGITTSTTFTTRNTEFRHLFIIIITWVKTKQRNIKNESSNWLKDHLLHDCWRRCFIWPTTISVGAQSTLGGHDIFARKICMKNKQIARILHDSCPKNYQNTRIFIIFARKIDKIP